MLFNSIEFVLFFILFFALWPIFRKQNIARWTLIVSASFLFYSWWDWRFLFLIIGSGLIDYCAGLLLIKKPNFKKLFLILSLLANLGALSVFKYSVFFAEVIAQFVGIFGLEINLVDNIPEFALILPVGISFYTFQSMSYTIDIYRGRLAPTKNILLFFSYLAMFPQLVAGPIIRAKDLIHQLKSYTIPNALTKWNAIKMIVFGLFQKVVIADNLSYLIDSAYQNKSIYDGPVFWWTVIIAFSFQIYCDFSGYSLIARGIAKFMGYHFKMNFNHPYISASLKDFWKRWHISLSQWFRDYVYIPIGGSKTTFLKGALALYVTMLLSGLWHGANWTFIIWGFLHGSLLFIERIVKWKKIFKAHIILTVFVFIQVTIAWVFFRANSWEQSIEVLEKLLFMQKVDLGFIDEYLNGFIFLLLAILIEIGIYYSFRKNAKHNIFNKGNRDIITISLCVLAILFLRGEGQQFIYFQF